MKQLYTYMLNCTIEELLLAFLAGAAFLSFIRWLIFGDKK